MFQKVISKKPSEFTGTLSISTKCVMLFTQSKERLASIPFAAHIKELYWSGLTLPALLQDGSKRTLYVPGVTSKKRKIDFRPVLALALDTNFSMYFAGYTPESSTSGARTPTFISA